MARSHDTTTSILRTIDGREAEIEVPVSIAWNGDDFDVEVTPRGRVCFDSAYTDEYVDLTEQEVQHIEDTLECTEIYAQGQDDAYWASEDFID